jgi:hypothetical protein
MIAIKVAEQYFDQSLGLLPGFEVPKYCARSLHEAILQAFLSRTSFLVL